MKNQKGFIGMGIIIAIVAVLAIGGIVYYAGTKNNPVVNTNNTSSPSITVLSPNGGEVWASGQSQTIKWAYSNLLGNVTIGLLREGGGLCSIKNTSVSNGSFTFTPIVGQGCPINTDYKLIAGSYKVVLYATHNDKTLDGTKGEYVASDKSDNSFTIVKTDKITSNDLANNICKVNNDCEYIWYTGGCYTPEYVNEIMKKCQNKSGPCPSEAQPRENVTCTCESNKCVTHN